MAEPRIVYRDRDLLIVDKPAGLPTTAPSGDRRCLVRWVERELPQAAAHPTSRLDSPVSGLVTFALTKAANQRLLHARRTNGYTRLYLGLTLHAPVSQSGDWSWPISIHPDNPKLRAPGSGAGERSALTHYEVMAHTAHASLLHLLPRTGRTHQLRVHAATGGSPLFGDHAYGGERRLSLPDGTVVTARRVMLHCAQVALSLPGGTRRFESPAPADMRRVWGALGGADGLLRPS